MWIKIIIFTCIISLKLQKISKLFDWKITKIIHFLYYLFTPTIIAELDSLHLLKMFTVSELFVSRKNQPIDRPFWCKKLYLCNRNFYLFPVQNYIKSTGSFYSKRQKRIRRKFFYACLRNSTLNVCLASPKW